MKNILKKMFGSIDRPVLPLWILLITFAVSFILSSISQEVSMKSFFIGGSVFVLVLLYNLILLLINKNKENEI